MERATPGWTVTELAERMRLKPQTISGWIKAGLVRPDKCGVGRAGHVLGVQGMMELLTVAELRRWGFSTQQIQIVVRNLRELSGQGRPLASLTLVISGNDLAWKGDEELGDPPVSALRKPGQCLMMFPAGERHAQLLTELVGPAVTDRADNR